MVNDNSILRNIKSIRKEMGLTQVEFAEKIGITRGAYSNIERHVSYPTLKVAAKINEIVNESGVSNEIIEGVNNWEIDNITSDKLIKLNKPNRLQCILKTIRGILRMHQDEFSNLFKIAKSNISNYESGNTNMPLIAYISIRAVLDKINDPMINDLIEAVVDNPEKYDIENITYTIDLFAKAICSGAKKELIRYTPIEYTKCDWLNEVINIK